MAESDCELCAIRGYRMCESCGAPIRGFGNHGNPGTLLLDAFGRELCVFCV